MSFRPVRISKRNRYFMSKLLIVGCIALAAAGCGNSASQMAISNNANQAPTRNEKTQSAVVHTTENQTPPAYSNTNANTNATASPGGKSKWTQSGNPIDAKKFDADIAIAEKLLKSKPNDSPAKKSVSEAYFARGFALTEARQYASALGDFRKAMKYDPNNEQAKEWIDQIISIYNSINKEFPKEGEEPPALPFTEEKKP